MTKEEAKDFLFDMSNLIGTTAMEYWTEKDAEKMRQSVLTIENESTQQEIIRCKDCKYYKTKFCALDTWTNEITIYKAQPDDFCSKAERKTDE